MSEALAFILGVFIGSALVTMAIQLDRYARFRTASAKLRFVDAGPISCPYCSDTKPHSHVAVDGKVLR